ncbi:MAG: MBL fold metallo-hydrolase [Vicinamibacterales bacterium]
MRRAMVACVLAMLGTVAIGLAGAQQSAPAPLPAIQKVKDNLYVIAGSDATNRAAFTGGNVGVFVTDAGVVLVDSKLANYGQAILDQVKSVTDKPITTLINTHTHGDHTGSNAYFGATVDIVAHENTKANMERMDAFKGENAKGLPDRTYKDRLTVGSGNDRVELYYFGPGHTNGDTFVVYPALRVLHAGDMFPWRDAPFLDRANGGSGVEMPNSLAKAIATIKDVETVIPGHNPVATFADFQQFQRFTADLLAEARTAHAAKKSADEAVAGSTLLSKYPGYKADRLKAAFEAIFAELNAR